jgi:threonine dehydratase
MDLVFVPVGGGGLISGIGAYLKEARPSAKMIGVQPKNASEMAKSVSSGRIVEPSTLPTVSDGTAGGLDPDTITFSYCKELVDDFVLVEEPEIIDALKLLEHHMGIQVEPAAALALAGILKRQDLVPGKNCIGIVCGGNIDPEQYLQLVSKNSPY